MLTNEMWFVIINKLSQTSDNELFRKRSKTKRKKLLTSADDYDNISELLKTTKNIDN